VSVELRYANSIAELDLLEPLWNALHAHHGEITPSIAGTTPARDAAGAWRRRRAKYERWLGDEDTFFAIAERDGEPVGYAFVTVGPGYASWATGERIAELETLSVLPESRGEGIGAALVDAAWRRLAELGIAEMAITTATTNLDAHRFYEQAGFVESFVIYYGRQDGRPPVGDPSSD
jgi:GNAT superfamily N-acetyltransferase